MPLKPISRRTILRAAGAAIPLPLLDAMSSRCQASHDVSAQARARMVLVSVPLGLHAPYFFPEGSGKDYRPSRYLNHLEPLRGDWTVLSGVSHHYGGGHGTRAGLMTAVAPENMRPGNIRNGISLDQEVATRIDYPVRFSSLIVGKTGLSFNAKGVVIPAETKAVEMFRRLFINGSAAEVAAEVVRIQHGRSILDGVREQASALSRQLGNRDRDRIELMMSSIREAEQHLQREQDWISRPKPQVDVEPFNDDFAGPSLIDRQRQWYSLVHLALLTDSTRVVSMNLHSHAGVAIGGQQIAHHDASHHGRNEDKIEQLALIEEAEVEAFAEFLGKLKESHEDGLSLLDQTQVLYASDLGNASAHTTDNLPVLIAGGGLRHAGHLEFDRKRNAPLANLFVRMLQQLGIEADRFGSSTGVMSEV